MCTFYLRVQNSARMQTTGNAGFVLALGGSAKRANESLVQDTWESLFFQHQKSMEMFGDSKKFAIIN
jgi:hypothetical protein